MKVSDLQNYLKSFNPDDELSVMIRKVECNDSSAGESMEFAEVHTIMKFDLNSNRVFIVGNYAKDR